MNVLDKFWFRFNTVVVECSELRDEKLSLEREHAELKKKLKEYMNGVVLEGTTRTMETSVQLIPRITITQLPGKQTQKFAAESSIISQSLSAVKI